MDIKDKIVVVLVGEEDEKELIDVLKNVKYVELRIDEFLKSFNEDLIIEWIKKIRKYGEYKIIGTIRWNREGGLNSFYIPDKKRLEIFRNISDFVDIIDVELKSKICSNVVEICKSKNKKIILSYHNFKKTPDIKMLKKLIKKSRKNGANIVKIATKVKNEKHLFTLLDLTYQYSKKLDLVVIPMGVSIYERLIPIIFGSIFTYVSINKRTAPSQPTYYEVSKFIDIIKEN